MLADALGRPLRFVLTGGQVHDIVVAPTLLEGCRGGALIADKAFDSNDFRQLLAHADMYTDQLGDPLRAGLIGTVGSIVSFKIGVREAEILAPEFALKPSDFTAMEPHKTYIRTGECSMELGMPPLRAKRFPSSQCRIVNQCRK